MTRRSLCRNPPTSRAAPMTRVRMIIVEAITESLAMVVCSPGPSITAEMRMTSISTIDRVSTSVP
ncbi:MAG: hypothetical protein L0K94_10875 [Acidipropionibacterium jensenii]|nr:hypothetical protein [Acidipropionibacterium jensenii]MDN5977413.1 hypothetical protein [Acidipropionibacterium jensenii]MDN6593046.1 hypothetical protein [Acidipropionibacterium jensenii]